jgi:hypothetical protein
MDFFNLLPAVLHQPFEETLLKPLRRQHREKQIAAQRRLPGEIDKLRAKIAALEVQQKAGESKLAQAERRVLDAQAEAKAARSEYDESDSNLSR